VVLCSVCCVLCEEERREGTILRTYRTYVRTNVPTYRPGPVTAELEAPLLPLRACTALDEQLRHVDVAEAHGEVQGRSPLRGAGVDNVTALAPYVTENISTEPARRKSIISMLRYAMLYYAMLCYVMLCYAMLCYARLCYAILCYAMLCYTVLCYAMLMLCCAMLCYVCCATLCKATQCNAKLCYVTLR